MSNIIKPFKLIPVLKDYIWGGEKLSLEWGKSTSAKKIAESWEFSLYPNSECKHCSGMSLKQLYDEQPEVFGDKVLDFQFFPMLIKLIDARDDLSIQVHPPDEYALQREEQYGKIETWYVLDAEVGASLLIGFKKDTTKAELDFAIKNGTVVELLNKVNVKPGDSVTIKPGTVHAIQQGVLLYEIQQNSNITYRLYDYNRCDNCGNKRTLHIEQAEEIIDFNEAKFEIVGDYVDSGFGKYRRIEKTAYYTLDEYIVSGKFSLQKTNSFMVITVVEGNLQLNNDIVIEKGDSYFIPANTNIILSSSNAKVLVAYV